MKVKKKPVRRTDEQKIELVMSLRAIDDVFFEKLMEDPDVCQEILQVILENPKLRIKDETLVAQKSIRNLAGRSVRLDAYVEGEEDKVFNIEIQRSDNCNHAKRVRFNASCITANNSEPGEEFENIQELYIIYISEFDIFGDGLTIYHAETTIRENNKAVNNGLHEIYVNTKCNDGSKIARLMEKFLQTEISDDEFPCMSNRVNYLKHEEREVNHMCRKIEEFAKDYAREYAEEYAKEKDIETAKSLFEQKVSFDVVQASIKSLTEEELKEIYENTKADS